MRYRRSTSSAAALAWLLGASLGLGACSAPVEKVEAPAASRVVWGDSEAPAAAPDEAPAATEEKAVKPAPAEPSDTDDGAIDIDLMIANAASARQAKPVPVAKPGAKPEPQPKLKPEPAPKAQPEPKPEPQPKPEAEPKPKAEPPLSNDPLAVELRKRRAEQAKKADARRAEAKKAEGNKPKADESASAPANKSASAYTGSDPCQAASFSLPRVREACASGGRPAAKRVMKDAVGNATATGQPLKCADCHSNQRDFALKANAIADLKRWLDG